MGFTNRILELISTNQLAKFLDYDRKSRAFVTLCPRASSIDAELMGFFVGPVSGRDLYGIRTVFVRV